jgi:hypothetical protein
MAETTQQDAPKGRKPPPWRKVFLAVLARTGNVAAATRAVSKERKTAYRTRERCPQFAAQWDSALETFADGIEAEAIRRAVKGVTRYKFYKGKPILHPDLCRCGHTWDDHEQDAACREEGCNCTHFLGQPYKERERSDALLALLLKGLRPDRYRDNLGLAPEEVDAFIERRISELAQERANQLTRNGTVHPPGPAPQGGPPPGSASAEPAAGGPAPGQGSQERGPEPVHPEEFPRRPPWLQGELPGGTSQTASENPPLC